MADFSTRFVGEGEAQILTKIHAECFPRYWNREAFTDFFSVKGTFAVLLENISSPSPLGRGRGEGSLPIQNFPHPATYMSRLIPEGEGILENAEPTAMMVYRVSYEQAEIITLAVRPKFRRLGFAEKLLLNSLSHCAELGAEKMFLEVEVGNAPAIKLYEKHGFKHISRRKLYYQQLDGSLTDALVMSKKL